MCLGGIAGSTDGCVKKCINKGNISLDTAVNEVYIGKICGRAPAQKVQKCENFGSEIIQNVKNVHEGI